MLPLSIASVLALLFLLPAALAKNSVCHCDSYKSWNWHYNNIIRDNFVAAQRYIVRVCYTTERKQLGFLMTTSLDRVPDHLFMPDGGECAYHSEEHILPFLTGSGWNCWGIYDLQAACKRDGTPLLNTPGVSN
ncbi:hypothetical protein HDU96_003626 [Phlyctochytrium bullatum]|nr:hypothetical protein HDU96_003626 [Phlyctochytrium bullatum]